MCDSKKIFFDKIDEIIKYKKVECENLCYDIRAEEEARMENSLQNAIEVWKNKNGVPSIEIRWDIVGSPVGKIGQKQIKKIKDSFNKIELQAFALKALVNKPVHVDEDAVLKGIENVMSAKLE